MSQLSIIALAGTRRDLDEACKFPPEVKWDKIVKVVIPDDHGSFPSLVGYESEDFAALESTCEDGQLYGYMQTCVDAVLDFVTRNSDRLSLLNFQNIKSTVSGMNTGGQMFVLVGFVTYEPMIVDKSRPFHVVGENLQ
jgi:hypothetical protein